MRMKQTLTPIGSIVRFVKPVISIIEMLGRSAVGRIRNRVLDRDIRRTPSLIIAFVFWAK
jgi:hypothetical protein